MYHCSGFVKFYQMLLNGGKYNGRRYLTRQAVETMTRVFTPNVTPSGWLGGTGYGLTFEIVNQPEERCCCTRPAHSATAALSVPKAGIQKAAVSAPLTPGLVFPRRQHTQGRRAAISRNHCHVRQPVAHLDRRGDPLGISRPGQPPRRVSVGIIESFRQNLDVPAIGKRDHVHRIAVGDVGEALAVRRIARACSLVLDLWSQEGVTKTLGHLEQ